jgi:hypothetical protein
MKRRIALAAQLAAVLCLGTFVGTALADNGQKPSDPPGKSGDAPGQEKKADQPAPPPAAPQPAAAQPQPAAPAASEQQGAVAKEKPAKPDRPARPVKPAKTERPATQPATTGTAQSSGHGRSDEAHHHVIICHRTGSDSNPYVVINIPLTAWHGGHTTHPDLNGRSDILLKDPASRPGSKDGFTKEDCESGAVAAATTTTTPTTTTTTTTTSTTTTTTTTSGGSTTAGGASVPGAAAISGPSAAAGSQPSGGVAGAVRAVEKPLGGVLGASGQLGRTAVKGTLPFTGLPLWGVALVALGLIALGLVLRRRQARTTVL